MRERLRRAWWQAADRVICTHCWRMTRLYTDSTRRETWDCARICHQEAATDE